MRIGWLCRYSPAMDLLYGGKAYEAMLYSFLCRTYDAKNIYPHASLVMPTPLKWLHEFNALRKMNVDYDVLITDSYSATMLNPNAKGRKIAIIHHMDSSQKKHPYLNKKLERKFVLEHEKVDTVVVPSQYWKKYLTEEWTENRHTTIKVVYNGFDVAEYDSVSPRTVEEFETKHNLTDDKPIVYLGPCQRAKGVVEAASIFKSRDFQLVTSGEKTVKVPAMHLDLSHHDFICLLKAADVVVALSKFKEGWNRVAHEAMLCKTPVVGMDSAGMGELLNSGHQYGISIGGTVNRFNSYLARQCREAVDMALEKKEEIGEAGYEYARNFTVERFEKGWKEAIENV